jgi:hypothetical protein
MSLQVFPLNKQQELTIKFVSPFYVPNSDGLSRIQALIENKVPGMIG